MRTTSPRVDTIGNAIRITRDIHLIVYVKGCYDCLRRFYRYCKRTNTLTSHADAAGKPIPVHDDASLANGSRFDMSHLQAIGASLLAFEVYVPFDAISELGDCLDNRDDYSNADEGRKLWLAGFHLVDTAKIPAGMGKLSGMSSASVKLTPNEVSAKSTMKTATMHGRSGTKIVKPTLGKELQGESRQYPKNGGIRATPAIIRESDDTGKVTKRIVLPNVVKVGGKRPSSHGKQQQFGNIKPTGKTAIAPPANDMPIREKLWIPANIFSPKWIEHYCI